MSSVLLLCFCISKALIPFYLRALSFGIFISSFSLLHSLCKCLLKLPIFYIKTKDKKADVFLSCNTRHRKVKEEVGRKRPQPSGRASIRQLLCLYRLNIHYNSNRKQHLPHLGFESANTNLLAAFLPHSSTCPHT